MIRTLPIRPELHIGESFASYVDRLAASLDASVLEVLARTGLFDKDGVTGPSVMAGYGVFLSPQRLRDFALAVRLPQERISAMLVTAFDGVACDFGKRDLQRPLDLRMAAKLNWVYFAGSHACPSCLEETKGTWSLSWKLPWSVACLRHRSLLIGACPNCTRRLRSGGQDARCSPAFPTRVPAPGACNNSLPITLRSAGHSKPCGYPLSEAKALLLDKEADHLIEAQAFIDRVIGGLRPRAVGEVVTQLQYFRDLRSLAGLVLGWGLSGELGKLPRACEVAFAEHAEAREKLRASRTDFVSRNRKRGYRHHIKAYMDAPSDPALLAAVLPTATSMLASSSRQELADVMEPLVLRMRNLERHNLHNRRRVFTTSPWLAEAWERCEKPHHTVGLRLGNRRGKGTPDHSANTLGPDRIPQLLQRDFYEGNFVDLLEPGMGREFARAFCSLALVKTTGTYSWAEAAVELGLPARAGRSLAINTITRLNKNGQGNLYVARIEDLARAMTTLPTLPNYGLRRKLFADFEVTLKEWRRICRLTGTHPGWPGRRRCYASVWLWCHVTGGHHLFAPWLANNSCRNTLRGYSNFVKIDLPLLETPLKAYGEAMLEKLRLEVQ